jgi:hypothetical protein
MAMVPLRNNSRTVEELREFISDGGRQRPKEAMPAMFAGYRHTDNAEECIPFGLQAVQKRYDVDGFEKHLNGEPEDTVSMGLVPFTNHRYDHATTNPDTGSGEEGLRTWLESNAARSKWSFKKAGRAIRLFLSEVKAGILGFERRHWHDAAGSYASALDDN